MDATVGRPMVLGLGRSGWWALGLSCCAGALLGETRPIRLEAEMSADEFRSFGLQRLSAEELAGLEQWLAAREARAAQAAPELAQVRAEAQAAREEAEAVRRRAEEEGVRFFAEPTPNRVSSRVAGRFAGFGGRGSEVTLENGQVWRLRENRRNRDGRDSPEVLVWKGGSGAWLLRVEGAGSAVAVERVR